MSRPARGFLRARRHRANAARCKLACRLAEKAYLAGERVLVWLDDAAAQLGSFDELLWTLRGPQLRAARALSRTRSSGRTRRCCSAARIAADSSRSSVLVNLGDDSTARRAATPDASSSSSTPTRPAARRPRALPALPRARSHAGDPHHQRPMTRPRNRRAIALRPRRYPASYTLSKMDKVYSPAEIEQRLYQRWEAAGYFAPRSAARRAPTAS